MSFLSRRRRARLPDGDARSSANTGPRIPARPSASSRRVPRDLRHRRFRGQALVEFALVIPLFMLLLLLAVDFGRLFFSYVQINNAAREAAAYAATAPTDNTAILAKARLETNSQAQRGEGTVTTDDQLCRRRRDDHRLLDVVGRRRRREPDQGHWPAKTSRS